MEKVILAYDCDNIELFEFDIIRAPFYNYINFDEVNDVDPRQYCVVKADNGIPYLVSVYDHWCKKAINRFEGRNLDCDVPIKVLPIDESVNYEKAYDCNEECLNYEFDKTKLVKQLNKLL